MSRKSGILLAVTGGIACGKSEVGRILASAGLSVLDADDLVHGQMRGPGKAFSSIVAAFGQDVVAADGGIDRKKLGEIVFRDRGRMGELTAIVHPLVKEQWRNWAKEKKGEGRDAAVIIPLLYEIGETNGWDAVMCVSAADDVVLARMTERGLTEEQTAQRVALQMDLAEKRKRSDAVIENNGTLDELKERTLEVLKKLTEKVRQDDE
ncbi:MAG: dephospho-CoA kinase [Verrucomicrobia bacterium]|nr:dephospho-CoA kinase [Verrucomicrobiota bacterium]